METAAGIVKRKFVLEGLDCANCAMKIENGVQNIDGVSACSVNFVNKTLTMEMVMDRSEEILEQTKKKIRALEPDVKVLEQGAAGIKRAHNHGHSRGHDHDHADDRGAEAAEDGHGHSHDHGAQSLKIMVARLAAGFVIGAAALSLSLGQELKLILFLASYLVVGGDIVYKALKNIVRGRVFDENFLMAIATVGAFVIGEYPEGVAVMFFYQIGELFQSIAVNRSRKSISALMDIRPDFANLKAGDEIKRVSPEEVRIGDFIVVRPGEKVPLDGKVAEGSSAMDTSALTGESVPREVAAGDDVLSGFINKHGVLTVEVTKVFGESTVAKILDLVENASSKKAPTENFITKFARYYTPFVVIVAALLAVLPPLIISGATFADWVYRALVFLVISCPCALVVSIPLGFFGGIGASSKNGVLVKGSNYLEALNDVKYVVFDKTGTLTKGAFKVNGIYPQNGWTEQELLRQAAFAEMHSTHPIAESIREAYGRELKEELLSGYNEISGHGIQVMFEGREVLAGNAKLMKRENIAFAAPAELGTIVHVAVGRQYAGYLVIADEVKEDSAQAIRSLKNLGVKKIVMLTGDIKAVGEAIGKKLGVDEVRAELLPQHKVEELEKIDRQKAGKEKIVFVGDGINDTPVLARADVGVAMGGLGSDAAIEAADIVIMTDEPSKLASAIHIAKSTRRIVWQNIIFALLVKAVFLLLGAFGIATMWEAVFSDVGVTLLAVLNAMRVLKIKPNLS
ncbi:MULTISPECIES: heavy metal translocating P-type ATPase [Paenibacillus]|uniref:Cadmium-translocating P-type ATPase n=1 Tax=Paenibacillus macerans TaxID=44252 RepID=A0A6N8EYS5_PAEMA|nr:heavy metal translocating P-type ATPase [Paenibacillus macerans]MBS5911443.1 cadmium-translocating P-type ATPase [Paenibacillus macerans]MUG23508.1 cadmium-translocating P-type ATPase [Paenibacillus macerans]UMV45173.1 cadmium-translocating P-type ATPase [Paenibacillus macerans]GBK60079.1 cadmium-translocating P-type ATPase [Paenibacillus macerans]GBK66375.1 cadmium-translocating P-type ATPase [Paenibacillus macerans]